MAYRNPVTILDEFDPVSQADVVERYARAHGGDVDLAKIAPAICSLGLSRAIKDRNIMLNLRSRLWRQSGKRTVTSGYTLRLQDHFEEAQ